MGADFRIYCHTCRKRTNSMGNITRAYSIRDLWKNLIAHNGHDIEISEFAKRAKCDGTCYQPEFCEGDCYNEETLA